MDMRRCCSRAPNSCVEFWTPAGKTISIASSPHTPKPLAADGVQCFAVEHWTARSGHHQGVDGVVPLLADAALAWYSPWQPTGTPA